MMSGSFHPIPSGPFLSLKDFFFLKHYRTHPDKQGETLKTVLCMGKGTKVILYVLSPQPFLQSILRLGKAPFLPKLFPFPIQIFFLITMPTQSVFIRSFLQEINK